MFVAIGLVGVLLFVLAHVVDDLFDGLVDGLLPESDWLSLSAVATLLTAFGLGAAVLQWRLGLSDPLAALGGLVAGGTLVTTTVRWGRYLRDMPTDATPSEADLLGCTGRVVTALRSGSSGEVVVRLGGQPVKLSALGPSDGPADLRPGTDIVVVEVVSPTRVRVESADRFWA